MKKHLRLSRLFITGILRRYYYIFIIGLAVGASLLWFIPRVQAFVPKTRKVEKIGLVGRFDERNLPNFIIKKVSIGLTQINPNGEPYPGIATKWIAQDKGQTWIVELDPNITWSDHQPIKAADINQQFLDVQVEVIDNHTIKYHLPDPYAPFPIILSKAIFKNQFTGIGPYQLRSVKLQGAYLQALDLEPISKNSTLPIIKYRFYPTEEAAKIGYKLGEIDSIYDLIDPSGFEGWTNTEITSNTHFDMYVGLFFNLSEQKPNFQQKNLRQALAYAIKDKTFGKERAFSPIPKTSWANNPNVKTYEYNFERAKELISKDQSDQALKINLATIPHLLPEAESIANDWRALGNIDVEVQVVNTIPTDFDVLLITQEIPHDPDQYALWHSTQVTNIIHYKNPKIDKLLEDGRKTVEIEKRKPIYQDFQRFINEDVPAIFLFHPIRYTLTRK